MDENSTVHLSIRRRRWLCYVSWHEVITSSLFFMFTGPFPYTRSDSLDVFVKTREVICSRVRSETERKVNGLVRKHLHKETS